MPLLRLVNQIVTMHLNAKETNEELREKRTSVTKVNNTSFFYLFRFKVIVYLPSVKKNYVYLVIYRS